MSNLFAFLVRVALTALVFFYAFPRLDGIAFHGALWPDAFIAAAIFSAVAWAVGGLISLASTLFAIGTFGLGLFILIPAFLLGFWMIPVLQLQAMAQMFPEYLSLASWQSAVIPGLLLLVVNGLGSDIFPRKDKN